MPTPHHAYKVNPLMSALQGMVLPWGGEMDVGP